MIGTGVFAVVVGGLLWYYDNDLRDWVKKRYGGHIKKGEDAVIDTAKQVKEKVVKNKLPADEQ